MPSAHKTFLENLSMPYEAGPSEQGFVFVEYFYKRDVKKASFSTKKVQGAAL
jgi:hypothetical protein